MRRSLLIAAFLFLTAPAAALADGVVTTKLSSTPDSVRAGKPWKVTLTIHQQGRAPRADLQPSIRIVDADGFSSTFPATAAKQAGRYHATVTAARDAGLPVRVGLEVEYLEGSEERIRQTLDGYAWDMLLGSVHWVSGLAVDWDAAPVWEMHAVADVWRMYVDAVCAAAASGIYDVMAHPDLAKVFGHRPEPKPFALYEQMADAFQAAGVCAEVSTAGYRRPLGEIYPDPDLLRMFRARGVPVTLASDAHSPGGVGLRFGDAVSVLTAAGYRTITLFRSREPRQEPLG